MKGYDSRTVRMRNKGEKEQLRTHPILDKKVFNVNTEILREMSEIQTPPGVKESTSTFCHGRPAIRNAIQMSH
jgi:hypothetical protein